MDPEQRGGEDLSSALTRAALIVGPVLALILLALLLTRDGDDTAPVNAAAPEPTRAKPEAKPAGEPRANAEPEPPPPPDPSEPRPASQPAGPASPFGAEPSVAVRVRPGERVELLDAPGGTPIARQGDETEFGSPSVFWVRRKEGSWLGVSTPEVPNGELAWIRADRRKLVDELVAHSILVDLSARTAELFMNGEEMRRWPVTVGAPGTETPTGRFAITDTFEGDLNPAYGCCALAISATQPDLPSGWMGGNRIAFHGTSGALGVAASSGCIRSADADLKALLGVVPLGTPVAIRQ